MSAMAGRLLDRQDLMILSITSCETEQVYEDPSGYVSADSTMSRFAEQMNSWTKPAQYAERDLFTGRPAGNKAVQMCNFETVQLQESAKQSLYEVHTSKLVMYKCI